MPGTFHTWTHLQHSYNNHVISEPLSSPVQRLINRDTSPYQVTESGFSLPDPEPNVLTALLLFPLHNVIGRHF